jgi:hypothetical protein
MLFSERYTLLQLRLKWSVLMIISTQARRWPNGRDESNRVSVTDILYSRSEAIEAFLKAHSNPGWGQKPQL